MAPCPCPIWYPACVHAQIIQAFSRLYFEKIMGLNKRLRRMIKRTPGTMCVWGDYFLCRITIFKSFSQSIKTSVISSHSKCPAFNKTLPASIFTSMPGMERYKSSGEDYFLSEKRISIKKLRSDQPTGIIPFASRQWPLAAQS